MTLTINYKNTCYDDISPDAVVKDLYDLIGYQKPLIFGGNVLKDFTATLADLGMCNESRLEEGELDMSLKGREISQDMIEYNDVFNWHDFSYSTFNGVKAREIDLLGCNFEGANFINADFNKTKVNTVNFSKATFNLINFNDAEINNVDFTDVNHRVSSFIHARIKNSKFNNSQFRKANFQYSKFQNVDFTDADLQYSDFQHAKFQNVNLFNTNIYCVNFRYSEHKKLNLLHVRNTNYTPT